VFNSLKYPFTGKFIYWERVTNQSCMPGDNDSKLDLGNACYHPVQDLSSSLCCLKYTDINIQDSNFCPLFCMGVTSGLS
jgi:hypothetical protein